MSKSALLSLIKELTAEIPVEELGKVVNSKLIEQSNSLRSNLNKTVHVLLINDELIDKLAPRAREKLEALPFAKGSAVRAILSRYRSFRKHKKGRIIKRTLTSTAEEGYPLVFDSFESVRRFLSGLGLQGRAAELYSYVQENPTIKNKLQELAGTDEIFTNSNSLISFLAELNPAVKDSRYKGNTEAASLYRDLYDKDLGFDVGHNIPVAYKQVQLVATNKTLLNKLIDRYTTELGIRGKLTSKDITQITNSVYKVAIPTAKGVAAEYSFVIEKSELDKQGKAAITVFIEGSKANQEAESEVRILNSFTFL